MALCSTAAWRNTMFHLHTHTFLLPTTLHTFPIKGRKEKEKRGFSYIFFMATCTGCACIAIRLYNAPIALPHTHNARF